MSTPVLASRPVGPIDVPELVRAFAPDAELDAVWRNELGGLTFHDGERPTDGLYRALCDRAPHDGAP